MDAIIIDYGSGNIHSAVKSFKRAADTMGKQVIVSSDPKAMEQATHIVLPGVGAFGDCMKGLQEVDGLIDTLREQVLEKQKPFLGICVGMQLLSTLGHEHGKTEGLNWIKGEVTPIKPTDPSLKIPHMGWNELKLNQPDHPILKNIQNGDHAYFVHSFHFECEDKKNVLATVDYAGEITAMVAKDNIIGTQFHPEKSQKTGLHIIENFLGL